MAAGETTPNGAQPQSSYEQALAEQREIINGADAELIPILQRRAQAALAIGQIKADHSLPVYVGAREQEVLDRARAANGPNSVLSGTSVDTLMRAVMKTSRGAQQGLVERDVRVVTGFRPTSDLTIGNYLGAVRPSVELQQDPDKELYIFVADLHGLTDTDPREIAPYRHAVVHDLIASGIDPQRCTVYMQSDIEDSVVEIANRVSPYISVGALASAPTLKDKMQDLVRRGVAASDEATNAKFALLGYPVLMAADIYAQRAELVPVGDDQSAHLEITRDIARRFNRAFDLQILVEPQNLVVNALRILSLDGKGKMSKSNPGQAILLTDDPELAGQKIAKAVTAGAGEWNDAIASHFTVAESIATEDQQQRLAEIRQAHNDGQAVMRDFKSLWSEITAQFLDQFQTVKAQINEADVVSALRYGADRAERNAQQTLSEMKEVMGF